MDATRRRLKGPKRPGSLARSGSHSGRARVPCKGVRPSCRSIQLAHARPACASFGRVSQECSHHACQRASPTVFLPSRLARDPARAKRISPERSATSPPPCDSEKNRHARESTRDATRRRLKGPKRPGSLASSGSRSGRLRMPRAGALAGKLKTFRIPLGRNADATHRHVRTQAQTHLGFRLG